MPNRDYCGNPLALNDDGFMMNPQEWSRDIALFLAREEEGLDDLTGDHWLVIDYIRGFYLEHGLAPMIRYICKTTGIKLKAIYSLFPSGPAQGACKLAGLPRPDGCV